MAHVLLPTPIIENAMKQQLFHNLLLNNKILSIHIKFEYFKQSRILPIS